MTDEYKEWLEKAEKLLPAWFVPRMMFDEWHFGLVLSTGQVLFIEHISNVRQAADGSIWIDVDMHSEKDAKGHFWGKDWNLVGAPTERTKASVNAAHIVFAVERADT